MIYRWNDGLTPAALARYGLDCEGVERVLDAAHSWRETRQDQVRTIGRGPAGVPVMVLAKRSPDVETLTIMEARPAYRWEAGIANVALRKWVAAHRIKPTQYALKQRPEFRATDGSPWARLNAWAWPPWNDAGDEWRDAYFARRSAAPRNNAKRIARRPAAAPAPKRQGRPRLSDDAKRRQISLRVPRSVLKRWRGTGKGWQTRMAERLAEPLPADADAALPFPPPAKRKRGQVTPGDAREPVSLRLPPDVLARWKASGSGWQTRMLERLAAP